jgi:hypothetical protein
MTIQEIISNFLLPVIAAAVTGLAGFIGMQLKKIYQKHVDDKTKEAVVRICVKAVEQLYHDLGGPEKLEKAKDGIQEMLKEKGIAISELEMDLLIESVVSEFNYGFMTGVTTPQTPGGASSPDKGSQDGDAEGYSEEGGSR